MSIEEIKKRNERHKELRESYQGFGVDTLYNKEIATHIFEIKHINDKSIDDKDYLLSIIEQAEKALERICADPHTHRPSRDFAFQVLKSIQGGE